MDLFNNEIGRNLSSENGKLHQIVKTALEAGDMKYLHPRGLTVNGNLLPAAANNYSVLIPTDQ